MVSVRAVYENGIFRPISEVVLREGATVQVVLPDVDAAYLSEEELGYPKGFFEKYAGALSEERMERPPQPPLDAGTTY